MCGKEIPHAAEGNVPSADLVLSFMKRAFQRKALFYMTHSLGQTWSLQSVIS